MLRRSGLFLAVFSWAALLGAILVPLAWARNLRTNDPGPRKLPPSERRYPPPPPRVAVPGGWSVAAHLLNATDAALQTGTFEGPDGVSTRPVGPACLKGLLNWRGKHVASPKSLLGGLVDKVGACVWGDACRCRCV
jgi:hypothetical protein